MEAALTQAFPSAARAIAERLGTISITTLEELREEIDSMGGDSLHRCELNSRQLSAVYHVAQRQQPRVGGQPAVAGALASSAVAASAGPAADVPEAVKAMAVLARFPCIPHVRRALALPLLTHAAHAQVQAVEYLRAANGDVNQAIRYVENMVHSLAVQVRQCGCVHAMRSDIPHTVNCCRSSAPHLASCTDTARIRERHRCRELAGAQRPRRGATKDCAGVDAGVRKEACRPAAPGGGSGVYGQGGCGSRPVREELVRARELARRCEPERRPAWEDC